MNEKNLVIIDVDTSYEDVLKLDKDKGVKLQFEDGENFLNLPDEYVNQLSHHNKTKFHVARSMHYGTLDISGNAKKIEVLRERKLKGNSNYASATARLEVRNKNPNKHYVWKRPDETKQAGYEGYEPTIDSEVDTFWKDKGGGSSTHIVSAFGEDELVLMEIPKEVHDERQQAIEGKSKSRIQASENTFTEDLQRLGGQEYKVTKGSDGKKWS